MIDEVKKQDSEVYEAMMAELNRQRNVIELIPSENIVSKAVLEATGSWLTNKYSEGMPGKRYYGGNEFVDVTETLANERAKKLFGAEHCNSQPHSGSQANIAAYWAVLNPGDKMMGMSLAEGGHLTHGHPVNMSGKLFDFMQYGVDKETEMLDMDVIANLAHQHKPKMILAGATAYPRHFDFKAFRKVADEVGAYFLTDMAHFAGLVAAKVHPNPMEYSDIVTSTTHKTLRGPRAGIILSKIEDRLDPDNKKNLAQKIDFAIIPGTQGGPLDHVIAAKAIAFREAMAPSFVDYQKQVLKNAKVLAKCLQDHGFRVISGGTDNHLMLVDVFEKGITGKKAEEVMDEAGLCCNKNAIPFDTRKPFNPSGIRIGTPAITTRGMKEREMEQVAAWIATVLKHADDAEMKKTVRDEVVKLCKDFPLPY